jgi:hypothetical protein
VIDDGGWDGLMFLMATPLANGITGSVVKEMHTHEWNELPSRVEESWKDEY